MTTKQLSITEFKAHCTAEIRAVEQGRTVVELTRHGKTVALVTPPPAAKSVAEWIGSGKGSVTYAPHYDPAAPAFAPEDWES